MWTANRRDRIYTQTLTSELGPTAVPIEFNLADQATASLKVWVNSSLPGRANVWVFHNLLTLVQCQAAIGTQDRGNGSGGTVDGICIPDSSPVDWQLPSDVRGVTLFWEAANSQENTGFDLHNQNQAVTIRLSEYV